MKSIIINFIILFVLVILSSIGIWYESNQFMTTYKSVTFLLILTAVQLIHLIFMLIKH